MNNKQQDSTYGSSSSLSYNSKEDQNQNKSSIEIKSNELEQKLNAMEDDNPFMIFDIGDKQRYQKEHIPGSKFAVCDEQTINSLLPKLPKDTEIILVADDQDYAKQMAQMARDKAGLQTRYLSRGISAWTGITTNKQDPKIKSNDLKNAIDKGKIKSGEVFLLDVREPDEFNQWNIEGSINIPLGQVSSSLQKIPKDKEVITICPHGNRSGMVTYMLQRQGYNAKTLEGGLKEWSSAFEYAVEEYEIADGKKIKVIQVRKIGKGCLSYIVYPLKVKTSSSSVTNSMNSKNDNDTKNNSKNVIVIDPVFPADEYIKITNLEIGSNAKIAYVLDTHLHADHLSAARELSEKTTAKLCISSYDDYSLNGYQIQNSRYPPYILLKEGKAETNERTDKNVKEKEETLQNIQIIHTPGHTQGALCFLIGDMLLFTGDTLFVDSIGRPDLRDKAKEFAPMLYESLHNKIFGLNNKSEIHVFPTHTEKIINSSEILSASLDNIYQNAKYVNLDKDAFVSKMVSITNPTPSQYKEIIQMNKGDEEIPSLDEIKDLEMGPNRCSIS
jgi:glyoxylase-like metal-dependent hydrolase (beta-lactamase superfamily II)/rhodanese-related sulfurtransferase